MYLSLHFHQHVYTLSNSTSLENFLPSIHSNLPSCQPLANFALHVSFFLPLQSPKSFKIILSTVSEKRYQHSRCSHKDTHPYSTIVWNIPGEASGLSGGNWEAFLALSSGGEGGDASQFSSSAYCTLDGSGSINKYAWNNGEKVWERFGI